MVIKYKCVQKFKDKHGYIFGYRIQDQQGNFKDIKSDQLKQAIKSNQITVINLKLTSDNRLIENKIMSQQSQVQKPVQKSNNTDIWLSKNLQMTSKKYMLIGRAKEIPTGCGKKCCLIKKSDIDYIVYIPDDVEVLNKDIDNLQFANEIQDIQGKIKVIGGKSLINVYRMFYKCKAQSLDLSSFDTSNVKVMSNMFHRCEAQSLDFSSFDTSNVKNMSSMFSDCKAQSLDLSSFDTSNVKDMDYMFSGCEAQSLDLSSFDTSSVEDMEFMFYCCKAQSLDLSSFDTSNVEDMDHMFTCCKAQSLDLSSFDTSNVKNMNAMFFECQAQSLDLSSFDTSNVEETHNIFYVYTGIIKTTDKRLLKDYKNRNS